MKKTLNVNIGSMAFVIDDDAYRMLKEYLDDVESRFEPGEHRETMADVEMRVADIFAENLASPRQVVNTDHVRYAISVIGNPGEFGERKYERAGREVRKLRRSREGRVLGGVCAGLAEYMNVDVTVVRLLAILVAIISMSVGFWAYVIMWLAIPAEPVRPGSAGRGGND